ncbi:MAG: alpha/beta fold hydrolase [Pseudomonadales bacterium]
MRILKRILLSLVTLAVVLSVTGAAYQWLAERSDLQRFPPPGSMVDVDGLQMHLDCRGNGRPLVLMEAGLTTGSWSWGRVPAGLREVTEVCTYDRPGMGWSEPIHHPADAGEVADRLHRLVGLAPIEGPYVLLGMSAGGVYVREYYRRYPDDVVGMVLVDSSHEQQGNRLPESGDPSQMERMLTLCRWLAPVGVVRLSGALDMLTDQPGIPETAKPLLKALYNRTTYCRGISNEMQAFAGDVRDVDPPASLGDLPLVVLSQGKEPEADETFGMTLEQARAMRREWDVLQQELTALSSRGERFVAEESGHPIQLEQPELVIDTVTDLIRVLRAPSG